MFGSLTYETALRDALIFPSVSLIGAPAPPLPNGL